jgi:hypothetical protein
MQTAVCAFLLALAASPAVALPTVAKKPSTPAAPAKKPTTPAAPAKKPTKPHVDASEATAQLQELMAAASGSLAKAERHHERKVQQARKAVEADLTSEARVLGAAVRRYDSELEKSAADLEKLVNVSKAALKEEEAKNTGTWGNDPGMEARARLGAQTGVASLEVRKAKRMRDRQVHAAQLRAEMPFEDSTMHLSRRVGDLSPVVDGAKSLLEAEAAKPVDDAAGVQTANATASNTANGTKRMELLVDSLKAAVKGNQAHIAASETHLDEAVSNSSKVLEAKMAKIEKGLEEDEHKEIQKVRQGATLPPLGSKKAHKRLRTPTPVPAGNKTKDDAAMKSLVALLTTAFKKSK